LALPLSASTVKIVQMQTQEDFLAGKLEDTSVDPLGRLQLADRVEKVVELDQPFLFAAAEHPEGVVIGTGNEGKVLLVRRDGTVTELFATAEPEVFAVLVDDDGSVIVGSSPKGKIYRQPAGAAPGSEPEVLAETGELYIWALARAADGALLVATGTEGKLFRIDAAGETSVLYDSEDTHIRSLLVKPSGNVVLGTAGRGLVVELTGASAAGGGARTLLDAAQPEIVALEMQGENLIVAALATEASLVDLSQPTATKEESESESSGDDEKKNGSEVSVSDGAVSIGSRPASYKGARSEIWRIDPAGAVETLWRFEKETVFDILWHDGRLWVATGLEGKLYSYQAKQMVLEKAVDDKQIVALLSPTGRKGDGWAFADKLAFASTNAASIFRFASGSERRGEFQSKVIDAGQRAKFGSLYWEGELGRGSGVGFKVRTGNSASPDATWSDWADALGDSLPGSSLDVSSVPAARYAQFAINLEGRDAGSSGQPVSPRIDLVELSYIEMNRRPEIESVTVLDPGEIMVQSNFNPANQAFEAVAPNRDGIFTTLEPVSGGSEVKRFKTLWKKGYRTVQWKAADPNSDELRFSLAFRRVTADSGSESADSETAGANDGWLTIAEELKDPFYSFDSTVLPDGRYRFRVEASDATGNPTGEALVADHLSKVVVVDHSSPTLVEARVRDGKLRIEVRDEASPLREAVISIDAGPWRPLEAADGLLDSRAETLLLDPPTGELLLLRVTDAAHNVTTYDLSGTLSR
jgi:hypothetical protein